MTNYSLELQNIIKYFGRRLIFENLSHTFYSGKVYGISGPNGSGKSTLVKIISNLISPTKGKIIHKLNEKVIDDIHLHNYLGFVSPYLFLYDEFTAEENLMHCSRIRGIKFDKEKSDMFLDQFKLYDRRNDLVRGYSSGMKQRLKYAFALLHNPSVLILDEPTSNLDNNGKEIVYDLIREQVKDRLLIIASNEETDLSLCSDVIELEAYKNKEKRESN